MGRSRMVRGRQSRRRVMEITQQDVEEVADAISSRFDRDIVRLVTMGLSVDEDILGTASGKAASDREIEARPSH